MLLMPYLSFGADKLHIFSTFAGSVAMPSSDTTCPKKELLISKRSHFRALHNRLCSPRWPITSFRFAKVSSKKLPKMITSSKYTRQFLQMRPSRTLSISLENVAGAPVNPKAYKETRTSQGMSQRLSSICLCQLH